MIASFLFLITPTSKSASSLSFAHAYPVPFLPSQGDKIITFANLSSIVTIKIFTLKGILVQTLQENDGDGLFAWDAKSSDGNDLESGIYLYVIEDTTDKKTGKLVIVR